jgi:hypothetical protein
MRISRTRIEPLMMPVTSIHRPLLLLILLLDSNVESSNMASLESGVGYFYLDTTGTSNVPGFKTVSQNCVPLVSEEII